jgi:hypothetical protein
VPACPRIHLPAACLPACSIYSLVALGFVAAFTLPAAYSANREAVQASYAGAVNAVSQRWAALGLSRKQKVRGSMGSSSMGSSSSIIMGICSPG